MDTLPKAHFTQYEISNFAKEGFYSQHNSNYWKGEKYLGIGPSAHSFNGMDRQWNIANNVRYIKQIYQGNCTRKKEKLNEKQRYNEYILTTLRTIWGVNINYIKNQFSAILNLFLLNFSQKMD